jgi:hypothetical protein
MGSKRSFSRHMRRWMAVFGVAAICLGPWSIGPAPADAAVAIGVGIPFPGLYVQYPYYPYPPPGYYPYYPPPGPAYSQAPGYAPRPTYPARTVPSGGNIARQLNQQELNSLQEAPFNPPPSPYYPPRY